MGLVSAKTLNAVLGIESLVASGVALSFVTQMFKVWYSESNIQSVGSALRKAGLDQTLPQFFPSNDRAPDKILLYLREEEGLDGLAKWFARQETAEVKAALQRAIIEMVQEEKDPAEIIQHTREVQVANRIPESETVQVVWSALMQAVTWNKKSDMLGAQALRHVSTYLNVIGNWTKSERAQLKLLVAVQEFAFGHQAFLKLFKNICLMLYKADHVGEDAIILWFTRGASNKGRTIFLAEMRPFVDWLRTAEEDDTA